MGFASGHLAEHPLPPGIANSLGVGGYQLLADIGGIGAGRLGPQGFLVVAPDPDPALPEATTHLVLHHSRLRDEREAATLVTLAAQLGYLRLSGYRVALERAGLRSQLSLVNPATGAILLRIPDRAPGRLFGGRGTLDRLLAEARGLPPAGPPPDLQRPELLHQTLLALALADDSIGGAEAVQLADRALELARADHVLDPPAALAAARQSGG